MIHPRRLWVGDRASELSVLQEGLGLNPCSSCVALKESLSTFLNLRIILYEMG